MIPRLQADSKIPVHYEYAGPLAFHPMQILLTTTERLVAGRQPPFGQIRSRLLAKYNRVTKSTDNERITCGCLALFYI